MGSCFPSQVMSVTIIMLWEFLPLLLWRVSSLTHTLRGVLRPTPPFRPVLEAWRGRRTLPLSCFLSPRGQHAKHSGGQAPAGSAVILWRVAYTLGSTSVSRAQIHPYPVGT
jgi:hypothetical protein